MSLIGSFFEYYIIFFDIIISIIFILKNIVVIIIEYKIKQLKADWNSTKILLSLFFIQTSWETIFSIIWKNK